MSDYGDGGLGHGNFLTPSIKNIYQAGYFLRNYQIVNFFASGQLLRKNWV